MVAEHKIRIVNGFEWKNNGQLASDLRYIFCAGCALLPIWPYAFVRYIWDQSRARVMCVIQSRQSEFWTFLEIVLWYILLRQLMRSETVSSVVLRLARGYEDDFQCYCFLSVAILCVHLCALNTFLWQFQTQMELSTYTCEYRCVTRLTVIGHCPMSIGVDSRGAALKLNGKMRRPQLSFSFCFLFLFWHTLSRGKTVVVSGKHAALNQKYIIQFRAGKLQPSGPMCHWKPLLPSPLNQSVFIWLRIEHICVAYYCYCYSSCLRIVSHTRIPQPISLHFAIVSRTVVRPSRAIRRIIIYEHDFNKIFEIEQAPFVRRMNDFQPVACSKSPFLSESWPETRRIHFVITASFFFILFI